MIITFAILYPSVYFFPACLQAAHILHDAQLPPQDDFPIFLSRIMVRIIKATITIRITDMIIVPINDLSYFVVLAISSLSASLYFLKNSMYIIPASSAIANNNPKAFVLPVNAHPN